VFTAARSDWESKFAYADCDYCTISKYKLSGNDGAHIVTLEDGVIKSTMLDANVNEDFKLDPEFNDARCLDLFTPSTLNVNLKLNYECGGEVDTLEVIDPAAFIIIDQQHSDEFYTILEA